MGQECDEVTRITAGYDITWLNTVLHHGINRRKFLVLKSRLRESFPVSMFDNPVQVSGYHGTCGIVHIHTAVIIRTKMQEQTIQDTLTGPRVQKARSSVEEVPDSRLGYTAAPKFKRSKSNPANTLTTIHLLSSVSTDPH
jgi:hypothetical protein